MNMIETQKPAQQNPIRIIRETDIETLADLNISSWDTIVSFFKNLNPTSRNYGDLIYIGGEGNLRLRELSPPHTPDFSPECAISSRGAQEPKHARYFGGGFLTNYHLADTSLAVVRTPICKPDNLQVSAYNSSQIIRHQRINEFKDLVELIGAQK